MSGLVIFLWRWLRSIGRPRSYRSTYVRVDVETEYDLEKEVRDLKQKERELRARLKLLEIQGTPRGRRHDE